MWTSLTGQHWSSVATLEVDPLKTNADLLAPFGTYSNWSLEHGTVPSAMKAAYITPIVKKVDMDPSECRICPVQAS